MYHVRPTSYTVLHSWSKNNTFDVGLKKRYGRDTALARPLLTLPINKNRFGFLIKLRGPGPGRAPPPDGRAFYDEIYFIVTSKKLDGVRHVRRCDSKVAMIHRAVSRCRPDWESGT
ncbi:hypothetical protein EVAR_38168_1 [Eumeta japonica]|uniref:Uncharacterized protein n=1 Tax=Eumeta variegata TaxID=151549 RepID=A0A4C1WEW5_EUMVA|nr:hypothetical protein EVAR_38168_1 [Eumeta japonica]